MPDTDRSSRVDHEDSADFDRREFDNRTTDELEAEITELCAHIEAATPCHGQDRSRLTARQATIQLNRGVERPSSRGESLPWDSWPRRRWARGRDKPSPGGPIRS